MSRSHSEYRILHESAYELPDVVTFIRLLNTLDEHPAAEARSLFDSHSEVFVARAPGRLDLMGGIADYSGSLVLQWPLREATLVAAQRTSDGRATVTSLPDQGGTERTADHAVEDLFPRGEPLDLESARQLFKAGPGGEWAAYALGMLVVLAHAKGLKKPEGVRLLIRSSVPEGKGVSSSAALEVAVMQAVASLFDLSIGPRELALLAQQVENR